MAHDGKLWRKNKLSLINLERALRAGRTPEEIEAKYLGEGCVKAAYVFETSKGKKYVVKLDANNGLMGQARMRPPDLSAYGIKTCYHTFAGKYVIQELTTPMNEVERKPELMQKFKDSYEIARKICKFGIKLPKGYIGDIHPGNVGFRDNGEVVCFDW